MSRHNENAGSSSKSNWFRNLRSSRRPTQQEQGAYPVHVSNLLSQMRDAERRRASMTPNIQVSPQRARAILRRYNYGCQPTSEVSTPTESQSRNFLPRSNSVPSESVSTAEETVVQDTASGISIDKDSNEPMDSDVDSLELEVGTEPVVTPPRATGTKQKTLKSRLQTKDDKGDLTASGSSESCSIADAGLSDSTSSDQDSSFEQFEQIDPYDADTIPDVSNQNFDLEYMPTDYNRDSGDTELPSTVDSFTFNNIRFQERRGHNRRTLASNPFFDMNLAGIISETNDEHGNPVESFENIPIVEPLSENLNGMRGVNAANRREPRNGELSPELEELNFNPIGHFVPNGRRVSNSEFYERFIRSTIRGHANPADIEMQAIRAIQHFQSHVRYTADSTAAMRNPILPEDLFVSTMRAVFPVLLLYPELVTESHNMIVNEAEYSCRIDTLNVLSPSMKVQVEDLSEKCVICQADYELDQDIRNLHCAHKFHVICIDTWCKTAVTCPVCRRSVDGNIIRQDTSSRAALMNMEHILGFLMGRRAASDNETGENQPCTSTSSNN